MVSVARLSLAGLLIFALAGAASAIPLTLSGPIAGNTVGPQSTSNPCVIAGTTCQQPAGFGYNNFTQSGAISSYNMYSTTPTATVADSVQGTPYTVSQILGVLGGSNSFLVAIDVNTSGAGGETLQLFQVIINGTVAYDYIGPTAIGGISNNGNGFADWTLGTVSLAGRAPTDTVLFHAVWNNASAGAESFFIIPGAATTVPEPSALQLLLVGSGVLGAGYLIRKRNSVTNQL